MIAPTTNGLSQYDVNFFDQLNSVCIPDGIYVKSKGFDPTGRVTALYFGHGGHEVEMPIAELLEKVEPYPNAPKQQLFGIRGAYDYRSKVERSVTQGNLQLVLQTQGQRQFADMSIPTAGEAEKIAIKDNLHGVVYMSAMKNQATQITRNELENGLPVGRVELSTPTRNIIG